MYKLKNSFNFASKLNKNENLIKFLKLKKKLKLAGTTTKTIKKNQTLHAISKFWKMRFIAKYSFL